jgi:hypothetical protein
MNNMMDSPEFIQQMSSVMSNPAVVDQLIASNPQLAAMGPQVRELFQSERFRQIMCVFFLAQSFCLYTTLRDFSYRTFTVNHSQSTF